MKQRQRKGISGFGLLISTEKRSTSSRLSGYGDGKINRKIFFGIIGYAYAGAYISREAYNWTAAIAIYVDENYRRQGIGSLLYKELEKMLRKQGIVNLLKKKLL